MRKRPLLLAAGFFLAGISYAADKDVRIFVLLPFLVLYLMLPQIKTFGGNGIGLRKACIRGGLILVLFVVGMLHMEQQMEFREAYLSEVTEGKSTTILGEISKMERNSFGYQIYLSNCYIFQNLKYIPCNDVLVYASDSQFHVGEIHKITGKLNTFSTARNEGNFDSASYYKSQKIDFYINMQSTKYVADNANWVTKNVYKLKETLGKVYEICLAERHAGVIKGMVLGDKSTLEEELKELFTLAGISHILAISGLHVSVIGRGLYHCLRKIGCGFLLSGIVAGSLLLLYGILTGNGISARRAIGMLFISMLGQVFGRSYDMLNALGAMCLFLLWENPFLIGYSGFWFFVTALFGVGFVGEVFTQETFSKKMFEREIVTSGISDTNGRENKPVSWGIRMLQHIENSLWMSIGVTITTLPIVAYCYFEVPILSSLINCLIIPFLTPLFFCALFGGIVGIFSVPLAKWLLYPCGWMLEMYEWICRLNEKLSFFIVITGKPSVEKIAVYYVVLMAGICLLKYRQELRLQEE